MALPLPTPFTGSIPTFTSRGGIGFDVHTKSQRSIPSVYDVEDVCGRDAWTKGSASMTINNIVDCQPVLAASISLSVTVAKDTTAENVEALIDYLRDYLVPALILEAA